MTIRTSAAIVIGAAALTGLAAGCSPATSASPAARHTTGVALSQPGPTSHAGKKPARPVSTVASPAISRSVSPATGPVVVPPARSTVPASPPATAPRTTPALSPRTTGTGSTGTVSGQYDNPKGTIPFAVGNYVDAGTEYPRYVISVSSGGYGHVAGTVTFIYQDGRTDDLGGYQATLASQTSGSGTLRFTFADGQTLTGFFPRGDTFTLANCGGVLKWAGPHTGCSFEYMGASN